MMLRKKVFIQIVAIMIGLFTAALPVRSEVAKPPAEERAAVVNGTIISRAEYDAEILLIQRNILGMGKPLTCARIAAVQKEVIEGLIRREILYQESRKAGTKIDGKSIDKEIAGIKKSFLSEAEYKNELSRRNLTEERFRGQLERNLMIQKYVEHQFAQKDKVKDADTIAYYESHLSLLKQPLMVRVSHILIQTDPRWQDSRKQEARKKAQQILKDLKRGNDFKTIAREQSDGPTRTSDGDLGYIRMGQLEKQFESVIFNLKTGEISEVIETDYGFHIFTVTDRKPESIVAYDAVKEQIKQHLLQEKAGQEADLHARKLREKADVKILLNEDSK